LLAAVVKQAYKRPHTGAHPRRLGAEKNKKELAEAEVMLGDLLAAAAIESGITQPV